eukprot:gnl/TRDRNA2_/TRDRNA2_129960_c0_seq2.p1 gnl/TRDRNA2_/TRDRNA2_129960_c0~~gnl/TRDRNA2_/TRDRNA2_129960_c0_seq2.p1  ORF type:complete len:345 (-),score=54.46 gnl/TRDRNA2_/TRDRNA2_129960_c0_seq2:3-1037(-)
MQEEGVLDDGDGKEQMSTHGWVRQHLASQYRICGDAMEAFGLLHRLDKETSGVLLCAKSYKGVNWIRMQWCSHGITKEYISLVHGWVDPHVKVVKKRIRADKKKICNSKRISAWTECAVSEYGQPAYTEVATLAHVFRTTEAGPEQYSLVALKIHTGRTHQIWVHMLHIGHPVVCDKLYAKSHFHADEVWCRRNFLHTYHLGFLDVPKCEQGKLSRRKRPVVNLYSPLPQDLRAALAALSPANEASSAQVSQFRSGDAASLCSFEQYAECILPVVKREKRSAVPWQAAVATSGASKHNEEEARKQRKEAKKRRKATAAAAAPDRIEAATRRRRKAKRQTNDVTL